MLLEGYFYRIEIGRCGLEISIAFTSTKFFFFFVVLYLFNNFFFLLFPSLKCKHDNFLDIKEKIYSASIYYAYTKVHKS